MNSFIRTVNICQSGTFKKLPHNEINTILGIVFTVTNSVILFSFSSQNFSDFGCFRSHDCRVVFNQHFFGFLFLNYFFGFFFFDQLFGNMCYYRFFFLSQNIWFDDFFFSFRVFFFDDDFIGVFFGLFSFFQKVFKNVFLHFSSRFRTLRLLLLLLRLTVFEPLAFTSFPHVFPLLLSVFSGIFNGFESVTMFFFKGRVTFLTVVEVFTFFTFVSDTDYRGDITTITLYFKVDVFTIFLFVLLHRASESFILLLLLLTHVLELLNKRFHHIFPLLVVSSSEGRTQ